MTSGSRDIPAHEIILSRIQGGGDAPALFWNGMEMSYADFWRRIEAWDERLAADGINAGDVAALYGDFSPETSAMMLAAIRRRAIIVPLTGDVDAELGGLLDMAGAAVLYRFSADDQATCECRPAPQTPDLIAKFRERGHPGLVVFTSGSTGKPKGILQDVAQVSRKFITPRKGWRTVLFLLMDHFGGFNTFLSTFAYGGAGVCLGGVRDPAVVARAIETARATLLPTTPTFLNFLIASRIYAAHDLSSVELITYGTELMPEATLQQVSEIFPNAKLKQTYGLSELGVLRSESRDNGSLWLKVGGSGFETKVVDGILWIRSEANMVGYLNAPDPFDAEGWMCTGDEVEIKDGYMRFLGRKTEVINTGGKKVYPIEVENVLMSLPNIRNATVEARPHPIMGQVVQAKVSLFDPEDPFELSERLRQQCNERLAKYKVPVRFIVVDAEGHHNVRFKKVRANLS